jgi:hypothetical protein
MWRSSSTVLFFTAVVAIGCGGRTVVVTPRAPIAAAVMSQLRGNQGAPPDLFWGVGGRTQAPSPEAIYTLKAKDTAGFSISYDVIDPNGLEWSAKIGPEAQTEVVVSRILSGLGYRQPPIYYLPSWRVRAGDGEVMRESEARFRPKLPHLRRLDEIWSWAENPFSGSRELKGLLVILLMLNSTDLKDSNNTIYRVTEGRPPSNWYVVRDLGAALGETGKLYPRRNWLEGFEREAFITAVEGSRIEFAYDGRHQDLLAMIGPDDVRWAAREMSRLTDAQWRDAFRAGNYAPQPAERFIRRIKEKIADGLAVRVDRRVEED